MTTGLRPLAGGAEEEARGYQLLSGGTVGVRADRVALEVLYYLPPEFLEAYEQLFHAAFGVPAGGSVGDKEGGMTVDLQRSKRKDGTAREVTSGDTAKAVGKAVGATSGGGKKYREYWVVQSEVALRKKYRLDAKLKELAVGVQKKATEGGSLRGAPPTDTQVCGGCKRFLEPVWKFCPTCGNASGNRATK